MKRYLFLIFYIFIITITLNSNEMDDNKTEKEDSTEEGSAEESIPQVRKDKKFFHNFSGGVALSPSLVFYTRYIESEGKYEKENDPSAPYPLLFATFKFDYQFLTKINEKYKTGFGTSFGYSINVSGSEYPMLSFPSPLLNIPLGIATAFIYNLVAELILFHRFNNRISFVNVFGSGGKWLRYLWLEIALGLDLILTTYRSYKDVQYDNDPKLNLLFSSYIFVGLLKFNTAKQEERRKLFGKKAESSNILGGFLELGFNFDKTIYPNYHTPIFTIGFGLEYRIGGYRF